MLSNKNKLENRVWEIGTLIKLVAGEDIRAITFVANRLRMNYNVDDLEDVDNNMIYDCYCRYTEEGL